MALASNETQTKSLAIYHCDGWASSVNDPCLSALWFPEEEMEALRTFLQFSEAKFQYQDL